MFKDSSEVLKFIQDEDVKFLNMKPHGFSWCPAVTFNIPASTVDEEFFTAGQLFDGSSIPRFREHPRVGHAAHPGRLHARTSTRSARRRRSP